MTIAQYRKNCKNDAMFQFLSTATEIWSNDTCLGYMIEALRQLGYADADIEEITAKAKSCFDCITVGEAAEIYRKSQF